MDSKKYKNIPELLAPAGNLEKMKIAFAFGADAVYFGIPDFSLRVRINKFNESEIKKAARFCKKAGKRFYVTLNIYAHQRHLGKLSKHLQLIKKIKPDGVIVSDPGILSVIRKKLPKQEIHLSTQANVTNSEAVKFWAKQGVKRIILAREITLDEIREIKKEEPGMALEYFVHGAMCMSYSGRCILSKWMANRSANLGDCAQPCRWKFDNVTNLTVIDDQKKFEVDLEEDAHGTYFFNSKDLCLIEHLKDLAEAGVASYKIEGRAKSIYYVAVVVRAYRKVLDACLNKKLSQQKLKKIILEQKKELNKLSNRGYTKGFLLNCEEPKHLFGSSSIDSGWSFVGISTGKENYSKSRQVFVHNKIQTGDVVEAILSKDNQKVKVISIFDEKGDLVKSAHGGQKKFFQIIFSKKLEGIFLMRKRNLK